MKLTTKDQWAVQGVISQAMAQGQENRWIKSTIKRDLGLLVNLYQVEDLVQDWEDKALYDATEANRRTYA